TIHTTVNGLTKFIKPCTPCEVPHTAPVGLLFKTNNFWDINTCFFSRFKCTQLCQATRTSTNNTNSHIFLLYLTLNLLSFAIGAQQKNLLCIARFNTAKVRHSIALYADGGSSRSTR